jgi:hypothetical protein
MHSLLSRGAVLAAGIGLAAGFAAPAHAATTTLQVRPADLIAAESGTAGPSTMTFLAEGIHISNPDANGDYFARAHFPIAALPLNQVHAVDYEWFGTEKTPGVYYDIDIDGDGKADGELIGESAYGGKDVWLNNNTTHPNTTFLPFSPCKPDDNTPQNGNVDGCTPPNGAGDPAHGTLDDWARSFAAGGKTATIVAGGFIANGLVENGVLRSITYGPNQYVFTSTAKSKVQATAEAKRATVHKNQKVKLVGNASPAQAGAKLTVQIKDKGKWNDVKVRVLAASGDFKLGAKPVKLGVNRFRVLVGETNATEAATTNVVKVKVIR